MPNQYTGPLPIWDRFWLRVDASGGSSACWPWRGGRDSKGYGSFCANGRDKKAHTVAYHLVYGHPPSGKPCILHHCDNPPCCNPSHLWAGTKADNNADRTVKGRGWLPPEESRKGRHACGERVAGAKLRAVDVQEIRKRAVWESKSALARTFGVSRRAVQLLLQRRTWRHVG